MKRVCHVQLLPLLSGVQRAMLEMFDHLDRRRFDLHVACQGPGPLSEELTQRGIPSHFVPRLVRPPRPWSDFRAIGDLERLFRREQFDLVHTHSSKPGFLGRLAARRAGVPRVVHHVQGFGFHEFSPAWERRLYALLERKAGQWCDRVVFVNDADRAQAIHDRLITPAQGVTIPNGVDVDRFHPHRRAAAGRRWRQAFELGDDETLFVFAGRLDPQKQPLLLPRIATEIEARARGEKWRLVVAGAGQLESALRARIAALGIGHRVVLAGWQAQPDDVLHAADILLQPSLWEGLPVVILEALAAGVPVVASDIRGNREALDAECGALCAPQDAAAYAEVLVRWMVDADLRERLGDAARRRAMRYFDARRTMGRVAELYEELLSDVSDPRTRRRAA